MIAPVPDFKTLHRHQAKSLRAEFADQHPLAANHAAANFMRALAPAASDVVAVYYPIDSELDTWPLIEALHIHGCTIALPVVAGTKKPLVFRRYRVGDDLIAGTYGINVPHEDAPELTPDIVLTPLLAFKKSGARLGMGGGFYDRTLSALRKKHNVPAVGYAYAGQEMKTFPVERHDEILNWVVTERDVFRVR